MPDPNDEVRPRSLSVIIVLSGVSAERPEASAVPFRYAVAAAAMDIAVEIHAVNSERIALHMCRGNWTADEGKALSGDYRPLVETLSSMRVGTMLLELCTPRAGEIEILTGLPAAMRIGIGACNQKHAHVESLASVVAHVERAINLFGAERVLLTPDCGFATFADNPVNSERIAEAKLGVLAQAAAALRAKHRVTL